MKKKGIIGTGTVAILAIVAYLTFDHLGGNTPVEIHLIKQKPASLAGKTYRGTPQDDELGKTFEDIESLKGINPGSYLHTIYEIEPAGKLDTMVVFIGINNPLPINGLEFKTFEEDSYLLATVKSNRWVMPSPKKVQQRLKEFARENKLRLSGVFIDKIVSEEEIRVIAPVN